MGRIEPKGLFAASARPNTERLYLLVELTFTTATHSISKFLLQERRISFVNWGKGIDYEMNEGILRTSAFWLTS